MWVNFCDVILSIGAIDVAYRAENGSINTLSGTTSLAMAGMDFTSEELVVRLEDGQQSAAITIPITDVSYIMVIEAMVKI